MKKLLNFQQWINESATFTLVSGTAAAHNAALTPNSTFQLEDSGDPLIVTSTATVKTVDGSSVELAQGNYTAADITNLAAKAHIAAGAQYLKPLPHNKGVMQPMQVEDPGFTPANIPPGE